MADLITLSKYKAARGDIANPDAPDPKDAQFQTAIASASALIRSYTGMEFNIVSSSTPPTQRDYEYDGSGWLDIGEAQSITSVNQHGNYPGAVSFPYTTYQFTGYPLNAPIKRWIKLPRYMYGMSPEMGFTWNLDTLADKYGYDDVSIVSVTAVWGWSKIPDDVQYAAIVTAQGLIDSPNTFQSETIANYSRTKAFSQANDDPLPPKARNALDPYLVPNI